jgi:hypothetical protein
VNGSERQARRNYQWVKRLTPKSRAITNLEKSFTHNSNPCLPATKFALCFQLAAQGDFTLQTGCSSESPFVAPQKSDMPVISASLAESWS